MSIQSDARLAAASLLERLRAAHGKRARDAARIGPALTAALASGRPTVVDLVPTQALAEPFRRGAFQPPRRLLPRYQAHSALVFRST